MPLHYFELSVSAACVLLTALPTSAIAQDAKSLPLKKLIDSATLDMPIATSPAAFMLGASGENVPRLTSFRAFATQIARAYDEEGRLANAISVELAPVLASNRVTWEQVTSGQVQRILARTLVSVATKPKDGDQPAQSALGVQSVLWAPAMDSALDLARQGDCRAVADVAKDLPFLSADGTPKEPPLPEVLQAKADACVKSVDAVLTKWNQPMVAIGIGRRQASSSEGVASTATPQSANAYWITASYGADLEPKEAASPVDRFGYLATAHFRHTSAVAVTADDGTSAVARQRLVGLNLRGGNAKLAGIAEYSITRNSAANVSIRDRKRALLGIEYKIANDLYLTVGTVRDSGAPAAQQSVLMNLNWGFGKEPVLLAK